MSGSHCSRRILLLAIVALAAGMAAIQSCSTGTMRTLYLPPNVKPDTTGPNYIQNVSEIKYWDRISPANRATNFAWWDPAGAVKEMNEFYDKVVVLTFFTSSYSTSMDQLTMLDTLNGRDTNVLFLTVAMKEGVRGGAAVMRIDSFAQAHDLSFEVLIGSPDFGFTYGGIDRVPTTFVIDRARRIVATFEGFVSEEKLLLAITEAESAE